ncbi:MAG: AAA family ATPase [Bacteroidales bacterium]|nr:AAA family ATPase [Bacteroidales bacterium]MCF8458723.1 AAA family ATPase [Bacteroidales bacterium]
MYIQRKVDIELEKWKADPSRKPLLIRGARQVGKTKTVREFGNKFEFYIEINFEASPRLKALFADELSPETICENIAAIYKTSILPGKTLLFFDEIQECQGAIASLRFFYENMPELHLIAAGSLLEFALSDMPTFGVGRIRSMFMYPLSFSEFLAGAGEQLLLDKIRGANPDQPMNGVLHTRLIDLVHKFLCLGGMPEVIARYIETGDLHNCQQLLDDLIISIQTDFSKYRKRTPVSRLNEVFQSVVYQAGQKFVYSRACAQANHSQVKEALQLLITAGLVIPVTHSSSNGLPLGAGANPQKQKMLVFDTGIFQRLLGLDLEQFLLSKKFDAINKGNLAEQFVGVELIKSESCYQIPSLYYWHREAKSSNAEVDYVLPISQEIVPVEVKAGTKGSMQSLYLFLQEKKLNRGIRISNENFSVYDSIDVYPLYAIENLRSK